jgi:hypothetical protein
LDFEDLLELARDSYVDQFKNFVDQHIKKYVQGGPEVKLKLPEESPLYKSIYCADFITPGLPPIKWRANLSSGCRFECFGFELDWAYIA